MNDINLLPDWKSNQQYLQMRIMGSVFLTVATSVIALFVLHAYLSQEKNKITNRLNELQHRLQNDENVSLGSSFADMKFIQQASFLPVHLAHTKMINLFNFLSELSLSRVPKIQITQVKRLKKTIVLCGYADSLNDLNSFLSLCENRKLFEKIMIKIVEQRKFQIHFFIQAKE